MKNPDMCTPLGLEGQTLSRRHFLLSSASTAVAQTSRQRPNVLFIASDDLSCALGCYGHPIVRTPNIDRLARRGVRFERAYTQYALCSPSRSSLMIGLAPDTTTVYDLQKHFRSVLPEVMTLPQCFQRNGYYTARVGKIYHYGNPGDIGTDGLDDPPSWNHKVNPRGIDKDEESKVTNHTPDRRGLGSAIAFYSSPAPDEMHTDGIVAAETIKLLEQNKDRPFFIAAGFYRPHCPYISPRKYFDMYPAEKMALYEYADDEMQIAPPWAYFTTPANWGMTVSQRREALQAYYAAITFTDANVGKLLAALDRLNLTDNTVVVFWSDHGYAVGEHGQWMKQTIFEAATRIPLIFAGPGVKARGKASPRTVEMLDFYPTLADLCGLQHIPTNLHGKSLRPLLEDPAARWDRPAISQIRRTGPRAEGGKVVDGYSIRTERYRYTEWNHGEEGEELYDYQTDSKEVKNLAKIPAQARVHDDLRRQLRAIAKLRGAPDPAAP